MILMMTVHPGYGGAGVHAGSVGQGVKFLREACTKLDVREGGRDA